VSVDAPERVLVSAHRGGAGLRSHLENTRQVIEAAIELGVDYVEFDVQRCADGTLVVAHDPWVTHHTADELAALAPDVVRYDDVLDQLAGRCRAHVDLKASATRGDGAVAAVAHAVDRLGPDGFVVTTGSDRAVRAVRDWAAGRGLDLLVGLSIGRGLRGLPVREQLRIIVEDLRPAHRLRASGATVVAANHWIALFGVARLARRERLRLLAWTVDSRLGLRWWLRPGRAWLVTSNHPALALSMRSSRAVVGSGRGR
jgi:glycerophosphoryl diester phosphodiesterase